MYKQTNVKKREGCIENFNKHYNKRGERTEIDEMKIRERHEKKTPITIKTRTEKKHKQLFVSI